MKQIYFDNAATTKVDEKVLKVMMPYFTEKFGNASSVHIMGTEAKQAMEDSRKKIASKLNAKPSEIFFTSGGTEGNNMILKGLWFHQLQNKTGKNHIITTRIEHDSILKVCEWLEKQGYPLEMLVAQAFQKEDFLVSLSDFYEDFETKSQREIAGGR